MKRVCLPCLIIAIGIVVWNRVYNAILDASEREGWIQ